MVGINNNMRKNRLLHWGPQVPHHRRTTFYPIEAPKYCTTTYVAPAYTTQGAEYYTTQGVEYYTKAAVYFNTTYSASEYFTDVSKYYTIKGIWIEAPKALLCPELLHH